MEINHGTGKWNVTYPSGKTFTATGKLVVGPLPTPGSPVYPVIDKGGKEPLLVLDPRAVIRNAEGVIVYMGPDKLPKLKLLP